MAEVKKFKSFLAEFNETCCRIGKNPKDITILGASKGQQVDSIKLAFEEALSILGKTFFRKLNKRFRKLEIFPPGILLALFRAEKPRE